MTGPGTIRSPLNPVVAPFSVQTRTAPAAVLIVRGCIIMPMLAVKLAESGPTKVNARLELAAGGATGAVVVVVDPVVVVVEADVDVVVDDETELVVLDEVVELVPTCVDVVDVEVVGAIEVVVEFGTVVVVEPGRIVVVVVGETVVVVVGMTVVLVRPAAVVVVVALERVVVVVEATVVVGPSGAGGVARSAGLASPPHALSANVLIPPTGAKRAML